MTETRLEKAQRLEDEGRVCAIMRRHNYIEARILRDGGFYRTVIYDSGCFFCTCDWGQHHSYTDDLCAHALAVKLAMGRTEL